MAWTVVYVGPGLCRRRRESPIPQQHNKERHTGATSCPQAAKETKLCQVAAHPAADAKHSSLFSVCVVTLNCGLLSPGSTWTTAARSEDEKGLLNHEQFIVVSLLLQ